MGGSLLTQVRHLRGPPVHDAGDRYRLPHNYDDPAGHHDDNGGRDNFVDGRLGLLLLVRVEAEKRLGDVADGTC